MIVYFCLYSFLGYLMESSYISLLQKRVVSSGLLKGPFIPLYGIGACLLLFCAPYFHSRVSMFIGGGILMTCLEYLASMFIEKVYNRKYWDYSHHHFQYQGRICLLYFCIWCILSGLLFHNIHPFVTTYIPINDMTLMISLICVTYILKSFLESLQHQHDKTLLKPKEKESNDSLS